MAIIEKVNGSAHGGLISASDLIDDETDLRVGFRIVCPRGWRIEGNMADTIFAFHAQDIANIGGLIPLEIPQAKVQVPDGPEGAMAYPEVEFTVRQ